MPLCSTAFPLTPPCPGLTYGDSVRTRVGSAPRRRNDEARTVTGGAGGGAGPGAMDGRRGEEGGKDNTPPEGFTALFNGKDLDGWQGAIQIDKRLKLKGEELDKGPEGGRREDPAALEGRGRRARQRRPGLQPGHGQGLRQHRAVRGLEDRAQGRQRHLPARRAAGANLGLGRPGRQPRRGQGQGLRRPVEQPQGVEGPATRARRPTRPPANGTHSTSS